MTQSPEQSSDLIEKIVAALHKILDEADVIEAVIDDHMTSVEVEGFIDLRALALAVVGLMPEAPPMEVSPIAAIAAAIAAADGRVPVSIQMAGQLAVIAVGTAPQEIGGSVADACYRCSACGTEWKAPLMQSTECPNCSSWIGPMSEAKPEITAHGTIEYQCFECDHRWPVAERTDCPKCNADEAPDFAAEASDALIRHMTNRFLAWRLPDDFNPDGGIRFEGVSMEGTLQEYRYEPTGTNLFNSAQAEAMVRYMFAGMKA